MDILGLAIQDYYRGSSSPIKVFINGEQDDPMHAEVFFRTKTDFNDVEILAVELVKGEILDVGAAAGCHSLVLQNHFPTDAIDISDLSCDIMRKRGVKNVFHLDVFELHDKKYDTILLLMNGLGICGTIEETKKLFVHLKSLLNPGGIIIGDSSDVKYMFENKTDFKSYENSGHYYGEVMFELEYKNQMTDPFPWLFIDPIKMKEVAQETGFEMELLLSNERYQYLAKFSINEN